MARRNKGHPGREGQYARGSSEDPVPAPVRAWQEEVHKPRVYDVEVDTSVLSPAACAAAIGRRLADGPPGTAFERLAGSASEKMNLTASEGGAK